MAWAAMAFAVDFDGTGTGGATVGVSAENTEGKAGLPRNACTWAKTVGTGGRASSTALSTSECWIWALSQP